MCRLWHFETDGLKALYFQGVETKRFQRGVKLCQLAPLLYLEVDREGQRHVLHHRLVDLSRAARVVVAGSHVVGVQAPS